MSAWGRGAERAAGLGAGGSDRLLDSGRGGPASGGKQDGCDSAGVALQVTTVHYLGTFLADPTDVPTEVVDYLAAQLGVGDPSCLKGYREREMTRLEHAREIRDAYGFADFSAAEAELGAWVDAQAWTSGDGPKALFDGSVLWLRERKVLLPGLSTLARLVARVRDEATQRFWDDLAGEEWSRVVDG